MSKRLKLGGSAVSKNIVEHKGKLKWCVKEAPLNELDNGWRFLSDIDTKECLVDPSNMVICDWSTIIELEPAIMIIFDMPEGTELTLIKEDGRRSFIDTITGEPVKFTEDSINYLLEKI